MGTTILNSLAPVFFVLGLGYFAGLRKMVDNKNVHSINVMLMNFALPCALFLAIARTSSKVLAQQYRLVVALGARHGLHLCAYLDIAAPNVPPPAERSRRSIFDRILFQ